MAEAGTDGGRPLVAIMRALPEAGVELLEERCEVRSGHVGITREELTELVAGADAIVGDVGEKVDAELLDAAGDGLRVVSNFAVGYDNIDVAGCERRGIRVTNTPDVLTDATAELAVGLTYAAARLFHHAETDLREGRWTGWEPEGYVGLELSGATFGVVGLGRIGRRYAELIRPAAGRILYTSRSPKPDAESELGAEQTELDDLLTRSDFVSLHAPGGEETRDMIGRDELDAIGERGVLVNTSRGTLVDAAELASALEDRRLGAAGLDVYPNEPEVPTELLEAPRCVLLPHVGSATRTARDEMARLVARNVVAVLDGEEPPAPVV
ncbi:D-glycerate dehydrogenase [Thermoleophilia bacterium SCSIO 60948]|nr:D-glycerate dehydrogenase [Thermoleophilia bacterium SCSIO 60948]